MTLSVLPGPGLKLATYEPSPLLSERVETYWSLEVNEPPQTVHILPDTLVDVVFDLNAQLAFVNGPLQAPQRYVHQRPAHLFGVGLKPGAATSLLGVNVSSLAAEWQPLAGVIGPLADGLSSLLFEARTAGERLAIADAFFLARLAATDVDRRVSHAIADIVSQEGSVDVPDVGQSAGASTRNLSRLFDAWVGMSPKRFARIVRLQTVLRRLEQDPASNLAALALDCGYSDQAHLTRELQSLAGLSPKRLAKTLAMQGVAVNGAKDDGGS